MFFLKGEEMSQLIWMGRTWLVKVEQEGGDALVEPQHEWDTSGLAIFLSGEAGLPKHS